MTLQGISGLKMGKKRKSSSGGHRNEATQQVEQTQYKINEQFAESEDEFFAGRDQILLDNGSSNKRRKVHRDGRASQSLAAYK